MTEKTIMLTAGALKLEAMLNEIPGEHGVVVTHPHPLYGGNMHNNVVSAIVQAYRQAGYSTLRFNFRGTGASEGEHENGIGEQQDVEAALAYLSNLGKRVIDLAGYSFGAWVNTLVLANVDQINRLILVSPPMALLDFSNLDCIERVREKIGLIVVGDSDEIAGQPNVIDQKIKSWNPASVFRIIPGADHFYSGKTVELKANLANYLT